MMAEGMCIEFGLLQRDWLSIPSHSTAVWRHSKNFLTDSAAGLKQMRRITFLNTREFFVSDKMCQCIQKQLIELMVERSQQAK